MPKQFFLPKFEARYGAELGVDPVADYPKYVRGIVSTRATHNEVFGFKLMSWYLDDFLTRLRNTRAFGDAATDDLALLRNAFPHLRFVHIHRRHSSDRRFHRARAADGSLEVEGGDCYPEPQFDAELIEQSLREAERQGKSGGIFQRLGIEAFQVQYESMPGL
jgi:LPS sulfotransferase NodH